MNTTPPAYRNINQINAYVCPSLHIMVTTNKDYGTTPMFLACRECMKKDKQQLAQSMGYNVDQNIQPGYEWYIPTDEDWKNLEADITPKQIIEAMREHVAKGGLLIRERK